MKNFGALRAIVTAGLIVGVLDISSAFVIWLERGVGLQRGLQGIAAGLLGTKSRTRAEWQRLAWVLPSTFSLHSWLFRSFTA